MLHDRKEILFSVAIFLRRPLLNFYINISKLNFAPIVMNLRQFLKLDSRSEFNRIF